MKLRKVGIIGTGHVGSHVAFSLALQGEVDELYMMDIDEKKAKAQAMDVNDAVSYIPHRVTVQLVRLKNVVIVIFLFLVQVHYLIYIKIA